MDEPQTAETPRLTGLALDNAVMRARIETLTQSGIIEVALQNPNVMSYMQEWETRAEKAEALVEVLTAAFQNLGLSLVSEASVARVGQMQRLESLADFAFLQARTKPTPA